MTQEYTTVNKRGGGLRRLFPLGFCGTSKIFKVYLNDVSSLVRGVVERLYLSKDGTKPFRPDPRVFQRLFDFRRHVLNRIPSTPILSVDQFIERFKGRKRAMYERAAETLKTESIQLRDSNLSFFVKAEKTDSEKDPAPRIINPRSARFNIELGRYLYPLEHNIYRAVDKLWKGPTIIKGYTQLEVADIIVNHWSRYNNPRAIGLDAERFDQCIGVAALTFEHSFYTEMYPHDQYLKGLLKMQLKSNGFARAIDGVVKYSLDGTRCSGDVNTSLGNCLIMCGLVWTRCQELAITASLVNNGDDCVVILEDSDVDTFNCGLSEWFRLFGIRMKVEPTVSILEHISFCQTSPVNLGSRWMMVRDPRTCITKDCLASFSVNTPNSYKSYLRTLGMCGLSLSQGVPMLQAFYLSMIRSGENAKLIEWHPSMDLSSVFGGGRTDRSRPISEMTRASFYEAFGIMPDVQEEFEGRMDNHKFCYEPYIDVKEGGGEYYPYETCFGLDA